MHQCPSGQSFPIRPEVVIGDTQFFKALFYCFSRIQEMYYNGFEDDKLFWRNLFFLPHRGELTKDARVSEDTFLVRDIRGRIGGFRTRGD
jgi:hypothetical protein